MIKLRDEFLSDEDLDLKSLSDGELDKLCTEWLIQAQISNDLDKFEYSHGVFEREPSSGEKILQRVSSTRDGKN